MTYTFDNPDLKGPLLRTYSALNSPFPADEAEGRVRTSLENGTVTLRDLWLLQDGVGNAHAALQLRTYPNQPRWRLGILRTTPNIPDDAAAFLFENVLELSKRGDPIHLVYTDKSVRDFGALPSQCGWQGGDDYGITYETDVSKRDDLEPDPAAVSYPLEYLLSDTFRQFYEPLRQPDPSETRSFEQIAQAIFEHHGNGVLVALEESGQPVAIGIVSTLRLEPDKNADGINMLGVALNKRRRGWGKRLHRHLMWEVKQRTARYVGTTDASNTAMRRLFELNGCTEAGRSWELEPDTSTRYT